jgi:hypothetical protein
MLLFGQSRSGTPWHCASVNSDFPTEGARQLRERGVNVGSDGSNDPGAPHSKRFLCQVDGCWKGSLASFFVTDRARFNMLGESSQSLLLLNMELLCF